MLYFSVPNTIGQKLIFETKAPSGKVNGYALKAGDVFVDKTYFSTKVYNGSGFPDGLINGGGSASAQLLTSTADKNFFGYWTKTTATSGDSRGIYWRHYLSGTIAATGYGDCMRAYTTVEGTGYSYASGIHATMQVSVGATVTGSGAGVRATLGADAASRTLVGKLASAHFCSDIATGNTLPTVHGFLRFTDDNSVRISNLAVIPVPANGTLFAAHITQVMSHSIRIVDDTGTPYYIMCTNLATNRN